MFNPQHHPFVGIAQISTITTAALAQFFQELNFLPSGSTPQGTNFVYVMVDSRRNIHYIGQTSSTNAGSRLRNYQTWIRQFSDVARPADAPMPLHDPLTHAEELIRYAPVIRLAHDYDLQIFAANVEHTEANSKEWEARIQALAALLVGNESIVGGSGWEMKPDSLRGQARTWLLERLDSLGYGHDID